MSTDMRPSPAACAGEYAFSWSRRQWLAALGAAAWLPSGRAAQATDQALHMLIPANPGGGWDMTARALGQAMIDARLVTDVRYENRGGAAGMIGLTQFANSYRGHPSALMVMGSVMLGGILTGKPPVTLDQVLPLARLTNEYNVFVLPPQSPFRSMKEVLRQFRNDPGSIKWGGGSRGSTEHIAIHLLAQDMGIAPRRINYVPFRGGGEAAAAVMGGYVSVGGSGLSEFLPHLTAGRMSAVAVTAAQRLPGVDAPTLRELGVDVVIGNWRGVCAPRGLDDLHRQALEQMVARAMASSSWQQALAQNQWMAEPLIGEDFRRFVADELLRLRDVMLKAGLA